MGKTIMVVDDDPSIRYSLGRLLEAKGYTVKLAYSGMDCMTLIGTLRGAVDLLLLDIMMPEVDGITTFYNIRKVYPTMKIIFLSAVQPSEEIKKILRDENQVSHLTKPFDYARLMDVIRQTLKEQ